VNDTIDIPRILVVPKGDVTYGFKPFKLNLDKFNLQPSERDILLKNLHDNSETTIAAQVGIREERAEDYIVRALIDFDDIAYDDHADLLYELSSQVIAHMKSYLSDDEIINVLDGNSITIADVVHAQMTEHFWEKQSGHDVKISAGFTPLKPCVYTTSAGREIDNFRETQTTLGNIKQKLFGGFKKCLYPYQKFDSDTERRFAIILDRDAEKWFKPAIGQFRISYKLGKDDRDYNPDFVAEMKDCILMCETKARNDMESHEVLAKANAASTWCQHASAYSKQHGGKPWHYLLIPHDDVSENMQLKNFMKYEF
jgi:type III restriction enzyme